MYQRYGCSSQGHPQRQGKPTVGEMGKSCPKPQNNRNQQNAGFRQNVGQRPQGKPSPQPKKPETSKKTSLSKEGILGLLPPALYHRESKKILGLFSAEDLLLVALMLLFLDSENEQDSILVYLLLYLLISDYIDLPF